MKNTFEEEHELISSILHKTREYTRGELTEMSMKKLRELNSKLKSPTYEYVTGKGE